MHMCWSPPTHPVCDGGIPALGLWGRGWLNTRHWTVDRWDWQRFHSHMHSQRGEEDAACCWSGPCRFVLKNRMDNQGLWGRLYINRIKRVEWPLVPRRGCELIWIFVRPFRELKLKTQGWVPCAWSLWWRALSGLATVVTGTDWDEDLLLGHQKLPWFYT